MPANKDPTPEEIEAECLRIQATWSPREKLRRLRADLRPSYRRCDGIRETIAAADYFEHCDTHIPEEENDVTFSRA